MVVTAGLTGTAIFMTVAVQTAAVPFDLRLVLGQRDLWKCGDFEKWVNFKCRLRAESLYFLTLHRFYYKFFFKLLQPPESIVLLFYP